MTLKLGPLLDTRDDSGSTRVGGIVPQFESSRSSAQKLTQVSGAELRGRDHLPALRSDWDESAQSFSCRHESPVLRMGKILSCDWLAGRVESTEIPHSVGFGSSATRVRQSTRPPSRAQKFNDERGIMFSQRTLW
uniref:Uncharacterized protein n=1 Tax=Sphaerodactylus townsendi TaxID=933632 RepID=A0ACB8FG85_9SAUR